MEIEIGTHILIIVSTLCYPVLSLEEKRGEHVVQLPLISLHHRYGLICFCNRCMDSMTQVCAERWRVSEGVTAGWHRSRQC